MQKLFFHVSYNQKSQEVDQALDGTFTRLDPHQPSVRKQAAAIPVPAYPAVVFEDDQGRRRSFYGEELVVQDVLDFDAAPNFEPPPEPEPPPEEPTP